MPKGGGGDRAAEQMAQKQAALAGSLFDESDPLRKALIARSSTYLNGGVDASPQFMAFKAAAEPQFNAARDSIIADTPAGGPLTSALTNLNANKARTLTQAQGGIDESELARALALGTGTVPTAVAGVGNAAGIEAQRAQTSAAQTAALYSALGEAVGGMAGGK